MRAEDGGAMSGYLDYSGRDDVPSGGVRKIPVDTPAGRFQVWVKRVGNHRTCGYCCCTADRAAPTSTSR
jgi:hypothetical protein